jgi:hypothetical protein
MVGGDKNASNLLAFVDPVIGDASTYTLIP